MTELLQPVLEQRAHDWFDAVAVRHSRRTYDGQHIDQARLDELSDACSSFRPYPDARVELIRDLDVDVFKGAIGTYGKVRNAPHILVVISSETAGGIHAGYTGEGAILEATHLGLSTCWVGGFFDRERTQLLVTLGEGERVVAVSPVGHADGTLSTSEEVMRDLARSRQRKATTVIAEDLDELWPGWARAAVECARLAPSAVNRQPWRFRMSGSGLVIRKTRGPELPSVTKALDCGIAMLHAELGAYECGVSGIWTDCENSPLSLARFDPDRAY